jgi:hypothetical protein
MNNIVRFIIYLLLYPHSSGHLGGGGYNFVVHWAACPPQEIIIVNVYDEFFIWI